MKTNAPTSFAVCDRAVGDVGCARICGRIAGPEGGALPGLSCAALGCAEGALRCSLREGGCDAAVGTAERGAHLTASRRPGGYAGLPLAALRCGLGQRPSPLRPSKSAQADLEPRPTLPAHMRPVRTPPSGLGTRCFLRRVEYKLPVPARLRVGRSGRELSAPRSAAWSGLPAAQRWDGEDCRAPLPAQRAKGRVPQPPWPGEHRRAPSPQARAPTLERPGLPARSLARDAPTAANTAKVRNGLQADRCGRALHRGSRQRGAATEPLAPC